MTVNLFILFITILLPYTNISPHLCHDPFIPRERIVVVPEERLIKIGKTGEFRVYVENTFDVTLRGLRLIVENPAFDIEITPREIPKLVPNERSFYTVKLTLKDTYADGEYPLKIDIEAESAILKPTADEVKIAVTERLKEVAPVEKLIMPQPELPELKLEKPPVPKLETPRPEKIKKEPAVEEEKPPVPAVNEVVVKVEVKERKMRYLAYFFGGIVVFGLILIFLWRKLRGK